MSNRFILAMIFVQVITLVVGFSLIIGALEQALQIIK